MAGVTPDQIGTVGTPTFMVLRYLADGTPDRSFAGGMVLLKNALSIDDRASVALQPDQKILIAATFGHRSTQGLLVRLNTDGTRDDEFGIHGEELITAAGSSSTTFNAIAVQPDSKIIVAGYADGALIARVLPTGMLDEGFGTTGYTVFTALGTSAPPSNFLALALQLDGRIVATGFGTPPGSTATAAFARFTSDGQLDSHFNGVGYLTTTVGDLGPFSSSSSIAFQHDGKILVTGDSCFCLVRLLGNDGSLDKGIGFGGVVYLPGPSGGVIRASILQSDGKLITVGGAQIDGIASAFVRRITPDLHSDTTFGIEGSIVIPGAGAGRFQAVALDNEGRILVAGHQATTASDPMLYRIWP